MSEACDSHEHRREIPHLHDEGRSTSAGKRRASRWSAPALKRRSKRAAPIAFLILLAGILRLVALQQLPAGTNPDEASNGYDAYCLLKTGHDRWGASWPILLEAFGHCDNRPALYAYCIMPMIALLGPDGLTLATRLPAAGLGVITVALLYGLARRVHGRQVGLWAALLLAVSPWHVFLCRVGHESSLTPFFTVLSIYTLQRTGLRFRAVPAADRDVSWFWVCSFALVVGLAFYSYASVKLFLPLLFLALALVYRRRLGTLLRRRGGSRAVSVGVILFAVIMIPIVHVTVTDWERINARALDESVFHQGWPLKDSLAVAARQYLAHYGPRFLFIRGDEFVLRTTPGIGQLNWHMLPFLGAAMLSLWRRRSPATALLVAWLLLYPIASTVTVGGANALRSASGPCVFAWIAGLGLRDLLHRRSFSVFRYRALARTMFLLVIAGNALWSGRRYLEGWTANPFVLAVVQKDLKDAVLDLRNRWRDYDRIFISDHLSVENRWPDFQPYIYVLFHLPVEPEVFHLWDKDVAYTAESGCFHKVQRMGPFIMCTRPEFFEDQFKNRPDERVLAVARPGDLTGGRLLTTIRDPTGTARFQIIEVLPAR